MHFTHVLVFGKYCALIYDMITEKLLPYIHLLGLLYNLLAIVSILIFERSVRKKQMSLNLIFLFIMWIYLIASFLGNIVLFTYFFAIESFREYLRQRIVNWSFILIIWIDFFCHFVCHLFSVNMYFWWFKRNDIQISKV